MVKTRPDLSLSYSDTSVELRYAAVPTGKGAARDHGGARTEDPEDALHHDPLIAPRPPDARLLGRQQRSYPLPFFVSEGRGGRGPTFRGHRLGRGRRWTGRGTVAKPPDGVAALRYSLVGPPPQRPPQPEAPFFLWPGQRQDEAAVRAGCTLQWSNGQTEGKIAKLKAIKRGMYGRAKFDLLRRRALHAA